VAKAYVALGSNLGDRYTNLTHALLRCGEIGSVVAGSPIYETDAVGGPDGQPSFLNAVLCLETDLEPQALLAALLAIEAERGRVRSGNLKEVRWGPRTLDLDILWYDGANIDEPGLTIPHREIRNRRFVLAPLVDVEPSLTDEDGPYAAALSASLDQTIRRVSGPVHPTEPRWMVGLADAVALTTEGDGFVCATTDDWSNRSGQMFGGFLTAVALRAASHRRPDQVPSQCTYRFLETVPSDAELEVSVSIDREGGTSAEMSIDLRLDGRLVGTSAVSTVGERRTPVVGPVAPQVLPQSQAVPVDRLIAERGGIAGMSARSWDPLQRWDLPDLIDGTDSVLRAWSPNVVAGSDDPYLIAASILLPIDALVWPATMQALERFPSASADGSWVSTPTLELGVRYADLAADAWHIGEARIDHLSGRTASATVRVWGASGAYTAIGHSLNLVQQKGA
jgi:2-amino-4-hydroxy-6-hydroxymethyldihydropteridine diphosphokinase